MVTDLYTMGSLYPSCVPQEEAQPSPKSSQALKQKLAQMVQAVYFSTSHLEHQVADSGY